MNYFKRLLVVFAVSLTGFLFSFGAAKASVNTPVIEEIKRGMEGTLAKPMITGLTDTGTVASVYIDGSFQGTGVADILLGSRYRFFFQVQNGLSEGTHSVMLIARNQATNELSSPSATVQFIVPAAVTPAPTPAPQPIPTPVPTSVPAPTLIYPQNNAHIGSQSPEITGFTKSGTFVKVYIDGVYNGKTRIVRHSSGTGAFFYRPAQKLSRGLHQVWVVAENTNGQMSTVSNSISFQVEYPMPAPVLLKAVVNNKTNVKRPFITGVAKNNSEVRIYIDNKLDGDFLVKNDISGTANFAYEPSYDLAKGKTHRIYAKAVDFRGKVSIKSNSLDYIYPKPAPKKVTAAPKKIDATPKIPQQVPQPSTGNQPQSNIQPVPQSPIAPTTPSTNTSQTNLNNLLNENNKVTEQVSTSSIFSTIKSKLSLNLIIFLVFLVGVIGWIFWVNRELARERKEKEAGLKEVIKNEEQKENPYEKFGSIDPNKNV